MNFIDDFDFGMTNVQFGVQSVFSLLDIRLKLSCY